MSARPDPSRRDPVILVEIDLWAGAETRTLRLSNVGPVTRDVIGTAAIDGTSVAHFDPRLSVPLAIGSRIVTGQRGDVLRDVGANGGTIEFALTDPGADALWPWLALHWGGRTFRIYEGQRGTRFRDFALAYTGRISDLRHDTYRASVEVTDASIDLNDVLVTDLYPDDDSVPEALRGRPRPELRGAGDNLAPVLLADTDDGAPLTYHVSRLPLDDILEVRVGGIPWTRVASNPSAGQWSADLLNGRFTLGGITGGLDVRCDARGIGWASMTTARLMTDLITEAGGVVDADAMTALDAAAPYLIGWYTGTDEVNRLSAFDEIMASVGGWWSTRIDGRFTAAVFEAPAALPDLSLSGVGIASMQLSGLLPPAWRIRIEHSRNWGPLSNFFDAVTEIDKQRWAETGTVAPAWSDESIKTDEPRAVDMPLIRSLVRSEADALAIRDRLVRVFGVARRIYEVSAWVDVPALYSTAAVNHRMTTGSYRVHGVVRGFGAGPATLQLWG